MMTRGDATPAPERVTGRRVIESCWRQGVAARNRDLV